MLVVSAPNHVVNRSDGVMNESAACLTPFAVKQVGQKGLGMAVVMPHQSHEAMSGSGCVAATAGFAASGAGLAASIARAGLPPRASVSRSRRLLVKVPMPTQHGRAE
jgi:2-methylaconitate cis-trans-isomerase PrpF